MLKVSVIQCTRVSAGTVHEPEGSHQGQHVPQHGLLLQLLYGLHAALSTQQHLSSLSMFCSPVPQHSRR